MTSLARRLRWSIPRPPRTDALLAVVLMVVGLVEVALTGAGHRALIMPLVPLTVAPVAWRRRAPFASLAVALAAVAAGMTVGYPGNATYLLLVLVIAFYSLGAYLELRPSAWRAGLALAALLVIVSWDGVRLDDFVFVTLLYGGAWLVGTFVRRPRQQSRELERQTAILATAHAETARQAVEEERARIARELHDVVAHGVSVMVIQAGAVRRRLGDSQDREREALQSVERTGRESLGELRRMLGILRGGEDDQLALDPQPGAAELEQLVEQVRQAGLPVELAVEGAAALPPGVALAVYRLVQEALTNVLKHAGPARATVTVLAGPRAVELRVSDDGRHRSAAPGNGHGLIGMRERVALYGGTFTAGPREQGGFEVHARLPLDTNGDGS